MHFQPGLFCQVHSAAQAQAEYHGKFQALALVNGHDSHQVFVFAQIFRATAIPSLLLLINQFQESAQGYAAVILIFRRTLTQKPQICLAQPALRQRAAGCVESAFPHEIPQEIAYSHGFCLKTPVFQSCPGVLAALSKRRLLRSALVKRFIERYIPSGFAQANFRKFLILEQKRRHFQCGQERHILQGIIQHRQQRRDGADFRQTEVAFRPVIIHRHSLLLQKFRQCRAYPCNLRQQNDHIPVFIRSARAVFLQGLGE